MTTHQVFKSVPKTTTTKREDRLIVDEEDAGVRSRLNHLISEKRSAEETSRRPFVVSRRKKQLEIENKRNMFANGSGRRQQSMSSSASLLTLCTIGILLVSLTSILSLTPMAVCASEEPATGSTVAQKDAQTSSSRAPTQPSVDRQVDAPSSQRQAPTASSSSSLPAAAAAAAASKPEKKPVKPTLTSQKKAMLASQQNYDKYQLKATNSQPAAASGQTAVAAAASSGAASATPSGDSTDPKEPSPDKSPAFKKSGPTQAVQNKPRATLSLLKKLLPSFITSAGPMAAAAATAALVSSSDKHPPLSSHSRSAPASALVGEPSGGPLLGKASQRLISMLASRKSAAAAGYGAVPDHAPFFVRPKPASDRQAGALGSIASGLLANPLSLGLLFSAPLIPSLLLTPLAIAGLSPAMSAINNFFGDDDEPAASSSPSPLMSALGSSPLASILSQATGVSQAASGSSDSASAQTASSPSSFALQAFQQLIAGPSSTTERPLFNPGMFASQGIGNAAGPIASAISSAASSSTSGSGSGSSGATGGSSPMRNFFSGSGSSGSLMQAAASMISPSFAAPPSQASGATVSAGSASGDSEDGPGLMQMASDVFDKVAAYMGSPNDAKDIGQASSQGAASSPLSALVGLSSLSPFQLSSLLAATPIGSAASGHGSHSHAHSHGTSAAGHANQKVGFISTLRNIYELFSSSFLRRQEVAGDSNECQQRLVCELHQRAMNSKLFRRSLQANLMDLSALDKSMIEQLKSGVQAQARVDAETKAMLNDFLKATNNFKNGRELVNCSKMFPKCSRAQLLSAANAHLVDPVNGRAIGKFSSLMKKMKFKSAQQHTSQWKLRKQQQKTPIMMQQQPAAGVIGQQPEPVDYMQVAPMPASSKQLSSNQLNPSDSLKLVQQILMMQQQINQQPQQPAQLQPQQAPSQIQPNPSTQAPQVPQQSNQQQYSSPSQMTQPPMQQYNQQASYVTPTLSSSASSFQATSGANNYYSSMPLAGAAAITTYSDSTGPIQSQQASLYSYTESPHSMPMMDASIDTSVAQQYQQNNHSGYYNGPMSMSEQQQQQQSMSEQQQQVNNSDNNKMMMAQQQQQQPSKQLAAVAA